MKNFTPVLVSMSFLFFSLASFCQQIDNTETPIRYGENPVSGKYMQLRNFSMYYEIYGQGEPLLLIHGNGGSISNMANQVPYFSRSYKVIAADSRSQGKSTDPQDSLSYEMMADDYAVLLDSLHLDSAYVIGWSDGGIIGLLLAIRHPEKVKKLAATGANIRPDTTAFSAREIQSMKDFVASLRAQKQDQKVKNDLKLTQMMIDEPNISGSSLQQIHCPAMIIGGDRDIIKPSHTLEIFQAIPRGYLWILPGSGHGTLIDFKDDFNDQVGKFFLD